MSERDARGPEDHELSLPFGRAPSAMTPTQADFIEALTKSKPAGAS
jgi:hypothetical protein